MRPLRGIVLGSLTALLLSGSVPTLTPAAGAEPQLADPQSPSCPAPKEGITKSNTIKKKSTVLQEYWDDDPLLGPADLPKQGKIGALLRGYTPFQPYNNAGAGDFLSCYWPVKGERVIPADEEIKRGEIRYPPADGFVTDEKGNPIEKPVPVAVGTKLELFGNNETGQFLAPDNTPYRKLAIPPSNLDTYQNEFPFNYHLFLVCMPFDAEFGQIAPWFEQPGGGSQYFIGDPKVSKTGTTIGALTRRGDLKDITNDATGCS